MDMYMLIDEQIDIEDIQRDRWMNDQIGGMRGWMGGSIDGWMDTW